MPEITRRSFVQGVFAVAPASLAAAAQEDKGGHAEEVAPPEDLMREHGVLNRILLIYDESIRRLEATPSALPPDVVSSAAGLIREFIEDYHEKLEEDHLFPRFEKAHVLEELVGVLRAQHAAGRRVTARIQQLATAATMKSAGDRQQLAAALGSFIRMYRPHEAREDTVLFPALRKVVSAHEFDALGDTFETRERQLFGQDGFGRVVDRVAALERRLGIYDLAQFTPKGT